MPLRSIQDVACISSSFLLLLSSSPWYGYATVCLTFTYYRILWLFLVFSCYKQSWYEQSCTGFFVDRWQSFHFYGTNLGVTLLGHMLSVCSVFKLSDCFLVQLYNFTLSPAMYKIHFLYIQHLMLSLLFFF